MDDYYETNKRRWNELVAIHANSDEYDLKGFLSGKVSLHQVELDALGDVSGKSLLHLQCHFGLDTISWARLGAKVTGVDFSEAAIELAKQIAQRIDVDAHFICCNIYDLPEVHKGKYDIVFTSFGVLCWLDDIKTWARIIANYLKPGGTFLIVESHPIFWVFDSEHPTELKIKYPYWFSKKPYSWDANGSYIDQDVKLTNTKSYEWNHTISDILNALILAGLIIIEVQEYPHLPWKPCPLARKDKDNAWRIAGDLLPLSWSVKAIKPKI
jgi:SAM-dependent methyltransferase